MIISCSLIASNDCSLSEIATPRTDVHPTPQTRLTKTTLKSHGSLPIRAEVAAGLLMSRRIPRVFEMTPGGAFVALGFGGVPHFLSGKLARPRRNGRSLSRSWHVVNLRVRSMLQNAASEVVPRDKPPRRARQNIEISDRRTSFDPEAIAAMIAAYQAVLTELRLSIRRVSFWLKATDRRRNPQIGTNGTATGPAGIVAAVPRRYGSPAPSALLSSRKVNITWSL
jgi:hypothetical protein